jgi:hypothetical protein
MRSQSLDQTDTYIKPSVLFLGQAILPRMQFARYTHAPKLSEIDRCLFILTPRLSRSKTFEVDPIGSSPSMATEKRAAHSGNRFGPYSKEGNDQQYPGVSRKTILALP